MRAHLDLEALSAYLDGELEREARARLEAHLEECAACRRRLAEVRRTVMMVRGLAPLTAPEGLREAIRARLEESAAGRRPWAPQWITALQRPAWRLAAAGAVVLVIGLFALSILTGPRTAERSATFESPSSPAPAAAAPKSGPDRLLTIEPVATGVGLPAGSGAPRLTGGSTIAQNAAVTLEVESFAEGAAALAQIADAAGGAVVEAQFARSRPAGVFVLQVPVNSFADVLERLEALGTVSDRRVREGNLGPSLIQLSTIQVTLQERR